MEKQFLTEYRCACGKLLFRALLLLSVVEVKCKRCGTLKLFRDELSLGVPVSFVLTIREDGRVYDACRTAEYVLAYPRETLLKMSIDELCPLLRDLLSPEFLPSLKLWGESRQSSPLVSRKVYPVRSKAPLAPVDAQAYRTLGGVNLPEQSPSYQLVRDNTFLLHDGRKLPAKSYFVKSDVPPEAYHIVNVISS